MIRAIVVDDERLARRKIRTFLDAHKDVQIVRECVNGREAIEAIRELHPDLVFLDVRMPGMDGLEVLRHLERSEVPRVVFVTAHGEYAVSAFEVEAIDYLLKPFDRRRFDQTIDRVRRERHSADDGAVRDRLVNLLDRLDAGRSEQRLTQFVVSARERIMFVDPRDVLWIGAEGKYVRLHTGSSSYLLREPISILEKRLNAQEFLRIHRSTLVNIRFVKEIFRGVGDDHVVVLKDGTRLPLSRRYRARIRSFLLS